MVSSALLFSETAGQTRSTVLPMVEATRVRGTSSSKSRGLWREGHVIEEFERPTVVDV